MYVCLSFRPSVCVQVEILALLRFLKVTKVQGMSREDSANVHEFREGSGKVQGGFKKFSGMFRKCSGKVQERFMEGSSRCLKVPEGV